MTSDDTHTDFERRDLSALSSWTQELAETFVSLASDIALVIDSDGVVQRVVQRPRDRLAPGADEWVGRPWAESVTTATRPKIEQLLREVRDVGHGRRREINHANGEGDAIPVAYTAVELGSGGPVLAVGRDLRAIAAIHKRFVEAQRELESDYWRARQADARYRVLFEAATDAVVLVDGQTLEIIECNDATAKLFDLPVDSIIGRPAAFAFDRVSSAVVEGLIAAALTSGEQSEVGARLARRVARTSIAVTPIHVDNEMRVMMRVRSVDTATNHADLDDVIKRLMNEATEPVAVTDASGRIIIANRALLGLVLATNDDEVRGRYLADWVSVDDQNFADFVGRVRDRVVLRGYSASVTRRDGEVISIRVSATVLTGDEQERIGFTFHDAVVRTPQVSLQTVVDKLGAMARNLEKGTFGDLATSVEGIARGFLVDAAMERCRGDRSRAADLLGISVADLATILESEHGTL